MNNHMELRKKHTYLKNIHLNEAFQIIYFIAIVMQYNCQGILSERFFKVGISSSKKVIFICFNERFISY